MSRGTTEFVLFAFIQFVCMIFGTTPVMTTSCVFCYPKRVVSGAELLQLCKEIMLENAIGCKMSLGAMRDIFPL